MVVLGGGAISYERGTPFEFRVTGFRVSSFGFWVLGFRVSGFGF